MSSPDGHGPASPGADPRGPGPVASAGNAPPGNPSPAAAPGTSAGRWVGRVLVISLGLAVAIVVAVNAGLITLPGALGGTVSTAAGAQAARSASEFAADKQWASATCTNILDWKNELHHDGTSLDLGFGPVARVKDAIAASTRMLDQLNKVGLPPAPNAQAQADAERLRSDLESRLHDIEGTAKSVAGGNLAAIGTLLSDLQNDAAVGTQLANELRRVVSVDLGLSLIDTRACRQLVGIPI
jgi:hypothetical protein